MFQGTENVNAVEVDVVGYLAQARAEVIAAPGGFLAVTLTMVSDQDQL